MTNPLLSQPTKIILTGGTSGIGAELCRTLLASGHQVVVLARRAAEMKDARGLYRLTCDLSDPDDVKRAAAQIAVDHADARLLINNAALQYDRALTDPQFQPERMEEEVTINLLAPALLTHAFVTMGRASSQSGAIVNINSGLAFFPKQRTALYCATKAALHSFSVSLRYQLEQSGSSVHEVFLPIVDTAMTQGRGSGKISAEEAADQILRVLAAGRETIWVGKARLVPVLLTLAPWLGRKALRGPQ